MHNWIAVLSFFCVFGIGTKTLAATVLLVDTDASCVLIVNGINQGNLSSNGIKHFDTQAGDQVVECFNRRYKYARQRIETHAQLDHQVRVSFSLKSRVDQCKKHAKELFIVDYDTLRSCRTGQEWNRVDERTLYWKEAYDHCADMRGRGWRLPTVREMRTIYDKELKGVCRRGGTSGACYVSKNFKIAWAEIWTNEYNAANREGKHFGVHNGQVKWLSAKGPGALCVRDIVW